jgi:CheY-like chemotaxis protein
VAKQDKGTTMTPKFLIATQHKDRFIPLAGALESLLQADIHWAATGKETIEQAGDLLPTLTLIDKILPDMDGLIAVRELMQANALLNTALVSPLPPEDFHEFSEGLGILVQLPESPGEKDARDIIASLKSIFALPPD